MKRKNLRDIIISLFLISTLGTATFIVSCSDQDNIISSINSDRHSPYHQHVHGLRGETSSPITATFSSVASGAAQEVGEIGMGWALSSMGLTASSPDWEAEFATINKDLNEIISLLAETNAELTEINNTLEILNCSIQNSSLQTQTGAIQNYLGIYNTLMTDAAEMDTNGQYVNFTNFADEVINGTSTVMSVAAALSDIQANVNTGTGVIVSCLGPIPKPANGTFRGDSVYYVTAQSLLNYYYYYQTIGLGLLSEAYHWKAWVAAGGPGTGKGFSADSVQLVCNDPNAIYDCNFVIVQTNNLYNTLLIEFKETGAPYTGEDLLFQKNTYGDIFVWVRSLEDFTEQSGSNCNYPLNINNLCGPTIGKFGSTSSTTTYYGTQNFKYPTSYYQLNSLVNPTPTTNGTIGNYLDSLGFENMNVNPPKVLIADTLIYLRSVGHDFNYYIDTMSVIPYISPGYPLFTVKDSHGNVYQRAIYSELYDFIGYASPTAIDVAMYYTGYEVTGSSSCGNNERAIKAHWSTPGLASPWGGSSGSIMFCQNLSDYDLYDITPFTWSSSANSPGWSYYSVNSHSQNAFFIPVRTDFSGSDGCLTDYSNLNAGGFITMCGEDFQNYLNLNLPVSPTCSIPNVSPPCTTLP